MLKTGWVVEWIERSPRSREVAGSSPGRAIASHAPRSHRRVESDVKHQSHTHTHTHKERASTCPSETLLHPKLHCGIEDIRRTTQFISAHESVREEKENNRDKSLCSKLLLRFKVIFVIEMYDIPF